MTLSVPHAHRVVLVVEDDPILRMDAMDLCEEAGFTVYGAQNALEAIRLLERRADICILFTDVEMPGAMDGLALAHVVHDRWPPVTIMVTSGRVRVTKDDMPANGLFFAKPYSPDGIIKALNEISARIQG